MKKVYFKTKRWYFAEQKPQHQGENAQTYVPTSTGSGGNKQQEVVAEFVVGNNNDVEAEDIETVTLDGHNVDSTNTLSNVRARNIVGDGNKVKVKGKLKTSVR